MKIAQHIIVLFIAENYVLKIYKYVTFDIFNLLILFPFIVLFFLFDFSVKSVTYFYF